MQSTEPVGSRVGSPEPVLREEDWTVPGDRAGELELDPWTAMLEDLADDGELLFPYPSGLP